MRIPGLGALRFHACTRPLDALDAWLGTRRLPGIAASIHALAPLPAPPAGPAPDQTVNYLTGRRFLHQTVFSAYSLIRETRQSFRLRVLSDGSLTDEDFGVLRHIFPGRIVHRAASEEEERIESVFPAHKFPASREARGQCPMFKKLFDIHGGAAGWNLYLDSDTFFHRRPDQLLACLREGKRPCFMWDRWSNYGHSPEFLDQLLGRRMIRNINAGVVGIQSDSIDWDRVEFWFAEMMKLDGQFVFYEQGVTAMLMSLADGLGLEPNNYILGPSRRETRRPTAAFHHYAGNSKFRYLRYNVPRALFTR